MDTSNTTIAIPHLVFHLAGVRDFGMNGTAGTESNPLNRNDWLCVC